MSGSIEASGEQLVARLVVSGTPGATVSAVVAGTERARALVGSDGAAVLEFTVPHWTFTQVSVAYTAGSERGPALELWIVAGL